MAMITETTCNIYCGPCESKHSENVAEFWCPNCDEGLCSKCMEYHKVSKASRMHKTITIENFTTLPDFVRNIDHVCSSHDNALDLYCSVHGEVCCMDCISAEHSECPGIKSLIKEVQGVKESAFYHSVVKHIEDLTEFATKLHTNRIDNVDKLQQEKDLLIGVVKSKRTEIASHLDKLKQHLLLQIDVTMVQESQKIEEAVSNLQKKICTLKEYKNHISAITDIATDMQAFLALKEIDNHVVHEEETMLCVTEETGMKETSVRIEFAKEIDGLVHEMKMMGNVELTKIATNMHFPGTKSQLVKSSSNIQPGIENIKLTFITKFQLPFDIDINICCCVILPDERVVLANNSNEEKGGIHIFL
ncbi:E3 ubiquitin-protein ligase TRIM45-like [Mytilus trossulus]|uniref:E3 ubiquitin-protein ligase TRIM45-like n=1 Tax=Mytilus trossulus TaxID=6551 RepID=UPI003007F084